MGATFASGSDSPWSRWAVKTLVIGFCLSHIADSRVLFPASPATRTCINVGAIIFYAKLIMTASRMFVKHYANDDVFPPSCVSKPSFFLDHDGGTPRTPDVDFLLFVGWMLGVSSDIATRVRKISPLIGLLPPASS